MIIPIRKNGRPWKEDCPAARARNETLRATRHYSRVFWKRWTGYHTRSRAQARMPSQLSFKPVALDLFDLKSFGERIAAVRRRSPPLLGPVEFQWLIPDRQTAEIHICSALMNRFNALGTAEIVRVA